MGSIFKSGKSAAKRAAKEAAKQAEQQHQQTLAQQKQTQAQNELQMSEANRISQEMSLRAEESKNLMENQLKLNQEDTDLADVVIGGEAEEKKDNTRKRRKGNSGLLSGTLGIGGS